MGSGVVARKGPKPLQSARSVGPSGPFPPSHPGLEAFDRW